MIEQYRYKGARKYKRQDFDLTIKQESQERRM